MCWLNRVQVVGVVMAVLSLPAAPLAAQTITVCWDGSGDYLTIQEGIDAASDGWVVVVCDGTYTGEGNYNLDFGGRKITVRSANDNPEDCTIDCTGSGSRRAFYFHTAETSESVVRGFTITEGHLTGAWPGAAILCGGEGGSSPTITNCRFEANEANEFFGNGGAIACLDGSSPIIANCLFVDNRAPATLSSDGKGGAIYCKEGSSPLIFNCVFTGNVARHYGGAIYCDTGRPIIMHCTVTGSQVLVSAQSHAIYFDSASPTIVNCLIHHNVVEDGQTPEYYGGGIACANGSTVFLTDCTIADNSTGAGEGGALRCVGNNNEVVLTNGILWGNTPDEIAPGSADLTITFSDVQDGTGEPWFGEGCIDGDPYFVSPEGNPLPPWDGDYYLRQDDPDPQNPDSPCMDAGRHTADDAGLGTFTTRIDFQRDLGQVDMGYHYPPDCNANDVPDFQELLDGALEDCNYNGVPDYCDIEVYFTSSDENRDDIPDECQGRPETGRFTNDADFVEGTLINVNRSATNQLQRNELARPLPYLNVAASANGTVLRIYTGYDIDPGESRILGEYATAPASSRDPSRTSVDLDGSVWVTNRSLYESKGSAIQVGLVIAGTRCDVTGRPNEYGEYVKPPFRYNTAIDRDGDGLIRTSRGSGDVLPWPAPSAPPDVTTADDECIRKFVRLEHATGTRHVSVNQDNDVWVGGYYTSDWFELIDGETGDLIDSFEFESGGYGGLIDCNGILWSTNRSDLSMIDPGSPESGVPGLYNGYGVGIDRDGNIWSTWQDRAEICKLHPDVRPWLVRSVPTGGTGPKGVAVRLEDNTIWVANTGSGTVTRLDGEDGTLVEIVDEPEIGGLTAVAIDADSYVWVTNQTLGTAVCIIPGDASNPEEDPSVVDPERVVNLGAGAAPYNFSDMTGQVTLHTSATGTWNVIYAGGVFGAEWHLVTWNRESCVAPHEPEGTTLTVEVRASDFQTALTSEPWTQPERSGKRLDAPPDPLPDNLVGRYMEVRVRFRGSCPGTDFKTPVVCDLTVSHGLGDMDCDGDVDSFDIDPFVLALTDPVAYGEEHPDCDYMLGDIDSDGDVDMFDLPLFVELVGGG